MKTLQKCLVFLLLLLCSLFTGCATLALTGVTMGAGYTLMNAANKTSNYPIKQVYMATILTLSDMDIKVFEDKEVNDGKGREIKAKADDLSISIDLKSITTNTTKMNVSVSKAVIILDKATADAIIEGAHQILADNKQYFKDKDEEIAPVRLLFTKKIKTLKPMIRPPSS